MLVGLSIKTKNYAIPDTAKSVPLQEKRKRDRPVKNKGLWSKERFFVCYVFLKINNIKCLMLYLIHMCSPHVHVLTFRHLHVKITLIATILLALLMLHILKFYHNLFKSVFHYD